MQQTRAMWPFLPTCCVCRAAMWQYQCRRNIQNTERVSRPLLGLYIQRKAEEMEWLFCMFAHDVAIMTCLALQLNKHLERRCWCSSHTKACSLCSIRSCTVPFFLALSLAFLPGKETKRLDVCTCYVLK